MASQPRDPFEFFKLPTNHSSDLLKQMSEAAQVIAQAQASYGNALLRANLAFLDAWFPKPPSSTGSEGPAAAARESEFSQV